MFKAAAEVVAISRRDVINALVAEAMDLLFHCTHLQQQASGTAAEGGNRTDDEMVADLLKFGEKLKG